MSKNKVTKQNKQFACDVFQCDRSYGSQAALYTHQRNKHNINGVQCLYCVNQYINNFRLYVHMKKKHSQLPKPKIDENNEENKYGHNQQTKSIKGGSQCLIENYQQQQQKYNIPVSLMNKRNKILQQLGYQIHGNSIQQSSGQNLNSENFVGESSLFNTDDGYNIQIVRENFQDNGANDRYMDNNVNEYYDMSNDDIEESISLYQQDI